ncbi:alpha/beta hydrolase [Candidatus Sororendozoicomonas aggregata]|uniref:alpha/beta hydrolase n=1 Tax=Candidatus Sororendozoicomonas aggregata TaxID=3073239 RepID=UPI002ED6A3A7
MIVSHVKANLSPLTFSCQPLSPDERDYASYYSIHADALHNEVSHELGYIDCPCYRIACHYYGLPSPKGTFFLFHGYYDHVGLFRHVLTFLLNRGYSVLAYDLPGHGLSSGALASIPDFSAYRDVLETILKASEGRLPRPWHAYGQSTGCAIITEMLLSCCETQKPLPFQRVVLSAPLVRPYLWKLGRLQLYASRWAISALPRKFTNNSCDQAFLAFAKQDPLAPRLLPVEWVNAMDRWIRRVEQAAHRIPLTPLIVQGTHDKTVDARHNIAILSRLYQQPEVLYLKGARHHLPNEIPSTRQEYMTWLGHWL